MEKEYTIVKNLNDKVEELDKKIDNIGDDNIIGHSTIDDINGLIKDINKDFKRVKGKNIRITSLRNIKIFGRAFQGLFPYLVAVGLIFAAQTGCGDIPFYRQEHFEFAHHEETIDYTGKVSENVIYSDDKADSTDSAYYVSKWEKKPDGRWYRAVKEYERFKNDSLDELFELAKNKDLNFEEIFGKVKDVKFEVRNDEPSEEEKGDYLKIVHRYKNEEDVMLVPQNFWVNLGLSALYLVACFVACGLVWIGRVEESNYDWGKHLARIKRENPNIDISEIKKLFEEKKIKFERRINPEVTLTDPITGEKQIIKK
jgi:hypothetical protein